MFPAASPEGTWMVGLFFFLFSSDLLNTSWPVPQGEGEQMVMDLQDVSATLEDQVAQSNIRLFGTSSQVLTVDPQDNEKDDSSEDDQGLSSEDDDESEDDAEESEDGEEGEDITPDGRNTGRSNHRAITRSLPSTSTKERIDIEYAESDSDLGEDEERILVHDDQNIPSDNDDNDEDMDNEDEDDDESTPKWKLNLSERAQHSSSRKARRKDWIKLVYSSSLSPEEILGEKEEDDDGDKQTDGDDDFFQIKNMETSESAVLDSGKDYIDPESLKKWEDEEMLDSIRHLFITGDDDDGPSAEGQDGEQDINDDENDASDPHSSNHKPHTARPPLVSPSTKRKLSNAKLTPNPPSLKNPELADQLALNRAGFEGIDADHDSRNLIKGFQPGQYIRIQLADVPCEKIENFVLYILSL